MSNIKLIYENSVVDAIKSPCYVVYVPRLQLFLACPESEAQGVASRNGTTYWHLEGRSEFGVDGYQTVSAVSISDEEAEELIAALEAGEQPIEPEPDEGTSDEEGSAGTQEVISLAAVYAYAQSTQAELDALSAAIEKGLSL